MRKLSTILIFLLMVALAACGRSSGTQDVEKGELIFSDDFSAGLDHHTWVVELDSTPQSEVYVENGRLITDTEGGVTVWLNKELDGNYVIEYQRTVMMGDGENDRVSDLNQFWMATDPNNDNLFTRSGRFGEYHELSQYYVGVGGNTNTTTRFRKYDGTGERIILDEKNEPPFLLEGNKTYLVRTIVHNGNTSFWMDDVCYFEYDDPEPLTKGYFGFRSTWSRHYIDFINIYRIKE